MLSLLAGYAMNISTAKTPGEATAIFREISHGRDSDPHKLRIVRPKGRARNRSRTVLRARRNRLFFTFKMIGAGGRTAARKTA